MQMRVMVRNAWDDHYIDWLFGVGTSRPAFKRYGYFGAVAVL